MRHAGKKLGYFSAFFVPLLVILGFYLGGYWNFLSLTFSFVVLPFIDQKLGIDTTNVSTEDYAVESERLYYRAVTYLWTFVQIAFVVWAAFAVASGALRSMTEWAVFIMGCALVTGGIGITVAHELGHKKSAIEQLYARLLLMTVCYMHFTIEHNRGHHVRVATPADPATARKNENFYLFWVRSVFGGYSHAWQLERDSLRRRGYRLFGIHNQMLWYAILPLVFCLIITATVSLYQDRLAWEVVVFFFSQSAIAFSLLELVNYVEHYGIERRELTPGKYERVNPLHSWNASQLLSNFFLFQLQRHSDHHVSAYKRYQVLNHYDESPQLPFGYPTMIMIALVPPLWFRMMNVRLEQWKQTLMPNTV